MDKLVQTRSEENGIRDFDTVKEAIAHAKEDETVWKISFLAASGERVRLINTSTGLVDKFLANYNIKNRWEYEPIDYIGL